MSDKIPDHVKMEPAQSSQIKAIGHDAAANRLYVEFPTKEGKPRSVYSYENVRAGDFDKLANRHGDPQHSMGRHFGQHFKSNPAHPYRKLDVGDE